MNGNGHLENLKFDIPASIVVFFVAIPLCLGIALASGAPLFSGIVSGIIGGIVVGIASGSRLGVSGPAAGLSAVALSSQATLGSWEAFLLAVMLAGVFQLIAGILRGGIIAYYFPSSVIKGMLTGIGIIIILRQIPLALGLNGETKGIMLDEGTHHLFTPFHHILNSIRLEPTLITIGSLIVILLYDKFLIPHYKIFRIIQGPLIVIFLGILVTWLANKGMLPFFVLAPNELVSIPVPSSAIGFLNQFHFPDFSQITNIKVYTVAIVIALIASLETLLCVEATDKLDSRKHVTPTDRELKAQGLGNIICGLIGGLPITQVIVRSSANITFGAKTKVSTILHGILLLVFVSTIPELLNMIPLATLSAILFVVGYKLAKPIIFIRMYRLGWQQFLPFITTVLGIIFKDLLVGIAVGMMLAIFIILKNHYKNSHEIFHYKEDEQHKIRLTLAEEVSFLNKGSILREFKNMPYGSEIIIDFSRTKAIDHDVLEAIEDFINSAKSKKINVRCIRNRR